jgi:hypothetical protein
MIGQQNLFEAFLCTLDKVILPIDISSFFGKVDHQEKSGNFFLNLKLIYFISPFFGNSIVLKNDLRVAFDGLDDPIFEKYVLAGDSISFEAMNLQVNIFDLVLHILAILSDNL